MEINLKTPEHIYSSLSNENLQWKEGEAQNKVINVQSNMWTIFVHNSQLSGDQALNFESFPSTSLFSELS